MWRRSPVRGSSASTRTPTSIEVRQAALTVARQVSSSPTWTGSVNVIRSIPAVTTRRPQWRIAAIAAASSQVFITMPPWTKPAVLASWTPAQRISSERESATGRGSSSPLTDCCRPAGAASVAVRAAAAAASPGESPAASPSTNRCCAWQPAISAAVVARSALSSAGPSPT